MMFHQYEIQISKILFITTSKFGPYLLSVNYLTFLLSKTTYQPPPTPHPLLHLISLLYSLPHLVAPPFTKTLMLSIPTIHPRYIDFYFLNLLHLSQPHHPPWFLTHDVISVKASQPAQLCFHTYLPYNYQIDL